MCTRLNMIDIEFSGTDAKSKEVRAAWKAYLDILNSTAMSGEVWNEKVLDLFVDLLLPSGGARRV